MLCSAASSRICQPLLRVMAGRSTAPSAPISKRTVVAPSIS
jgi:hypothetical protein